MKKKLLAVLLTAAMAVTALAGCGSKDTDTQKSAYDDVEVGDTDYTKYDGDTIKIAVATYSTTDAEVLAFKDYYVNYLAPNFNVELLYPDKEIMDADAELDFIQKAAAWGAQAYIAFVTMDLEVTVTSCEAYGMYCVMGAGMADEDIMAKIQDNEYYLGCTGPTNQAELDAGKEMAAYFAGQDTEKNQNYLIVSGGGSMGNDMHAFRTQAMIEELAAEYGFDVPSNMEDYTRATATCELDTGNSGITVTIFPGYPMSDSYYVDLQNLLTTTQYAYVMDAMGPSGIIDSVAAGEKAFNTDIQIGSVDCFTDDEEALFNNTDQFGNSQVNYLAGKYGSLVGCAFAAAFNAATGNADTLRDDGHAFAVYQGYWYATSKDEFNECYKLATDTSCIAYSVNDLMSVITVCNPDASFEAFEKLAGEYDIDSVKARRGL